LGCERLLASHQPPLTVSQFVALRAIDDEGVSRTELARRTGVSGPAVSQLIAGLTDAGLLARQEFAPDRRRQTLIVTPHGHAALHSSHHLLSERLSTLLVDLPRPEIDALARALPSLAAALSGVPPPRRPAPPPPPAHQPGARPRPPKP
jgi:DNA-binding MarR family transcriptional regulator